MPMCGTAKMEAMPATLMPEIKSLTGLRGVAASFVMMYHFTDTSLGSGPVSVFIRKGYIWVDLFFILSGFIMALSFAGRFFNSQGDLLAAYRSFLARRLARIFPLYLLVTAELALVAWWTAEQVPGLDSFRLAIAANLAMVQAWAIAPSFEGAAWSISTEWAAYLLFPVLLAMTLAPRRQVAIVFGLVCLAVIAILAATPGLHFAGQLRMGPLDIYSPASTAPLLRCLAEFSLGLLAYRWFRASAARPGQRKQLVRWSVPLFLLLLAALAIPNADVIVVALFPLLVAVLALQTGPLSHLFASRIPVWLGEISYSLYLLHGKFIHVVGWGDHLLQPLGRGGHAISVVLTMMLVCACTTVVYHTVERPCRIMVRSAFEGNFYIGRRRTA